MEKKCNHCKVPKELKDFPKHPRTSDGRDGTCTECKNEKAKQRARDKKKENELFGII